ncbi:MAG TPA: hypothetical protein VIU11_14470 [Nakamurella sp.]
MAIRVDVDGVPRVLGMLDALDNACERQLDDSCNDSADQVAQRTRGLMPFGPEPRGHARSSVDVEHVAGMHARVGEGGPRFPYVGWLDFGGNVGRRHLRHRTWIRGGRYLFRALSTVKPGIEPHMHQGMRQACRETGWDPSG